MNDVPKLMKRKDNQLEMYVCRKAKTFQKLEPTYEYVALFLYEVLYLWRALPNCDDECLNAIIEGESQTIKFGC